MTDDIFKIKYFEVHEDSQVIYHIENGIGYINVRQSRNVDSTWKQPTFQVSLWYSLVNYSEVLAIKSLLEKAQTIVDLISIELELENFAPLHNPIGLK